ncbi:MAG: aminoacyl-tRNA hydrolase [Clostridia bacterium]|nr:aminoacyl-tRNA hydrolase [Clostridia bacterium]
MASIFDLFKSIEKKEDTTPITHIIVGLGNPGEKYAYTRHNAGFLAIDNLCLKHSGSCDRLKFRALVGEIKLGGIRALLMKPQTFMNASGLAIKEACDFYKIPPENVIVISDDASFDIGRLRIRKSGSAGGHNGLKSVIECLGSDKFPRIKLGVGQKPSPDYDIADWVLARIPKESEKTFSALLELVPPALEMMLKGDIEGAMCEFNGKAIKG